jgi:hypothetical protein
MYRRRLCDAEHRVDRGSAQNRRRHGLKLARLYGGRKQALDLSPRVPRRVGTPLLDKIERRHRRHVKVARAHDFRKEHAPGGHHGLGLAHHGGNLFVLERAAALPVRVVNSPGHQPLLEVAPHDGVVAHRHALLVHLAVQRAYLADQRRRDVPEAAHGRHVDRHCNVRPLVRRHLVEARVRHGRVVLAQRHLRAALEVAGAGRVGAVVRLDDAPLDRAALGAHKVAANALDHAARLCPGHGGVEARKEIHGATGLARVSLGFCSGLARVFAGN